MKNNLLLKIIVVLMISILLIGVYPSSGKFDNSIDRLWYEVSNRYEIMAMRKKEYLNWRYCARSDEQYEVFVARLDDNIVGYIVCAIKDVKGGKHGYIADILTNSDRVFKILIEYSLEYLTHKNVDMIKLWIPPALTGLSVVGKIGFIPSPNIVPLTCL